MWVCVQRRAAALEKEVDAANRLAAMMERRVSMLECVLRRERAERPGPQAAVAAAVAMVAPGVAETEAAEEAALKSELAATRQSMLSAQKDHACASECVLTSQLAYTGAVRASMPALRHSEMLAWLCVRTAACPRHTTARF